MNGFKGRGESVGLNRADEVEDLIDAVKALIIPYIRDADASAPIRASGGLDSNGSTDSSSDGRRQPARNVLVDYHEPSQLVEKLRFSLPEQGGRGKDGLLETVRDVLRYSVNTWDQGFMDKLYSSTNAVGVVSELLLSVLNTNVHVYQVSPALTIIEKTTAKQLAALFGLTGPRAGGVTCQGGSGSNLTSLVIARNTLYPETREGGNGGRAFVLFTSAHGHYSVEKAATTCGMGRSSVRSVAVDGEGRMDAAALRRAVLRARGEGGTPLYVNATAGTTVLGSYDPLDAVADVCAEFGMWMHVDASWGGPAVFSLSAARRRKLAGSGRADSVTVNPHKMLNVPVTCSFLLTDDVAVFHRANTLPAGYLFHGADAGDSGGSEVWDLADLTLQCGRRGDSLKMALAWVFYGRDGLGRQVDHAFEMAGYLAGVVAAKREYFSLVSSNPPPCLQVCFYYAPHGAVAEDKEENTRITKEIVGRLITERGFMIDYAPGEKGSFFRVVVNCQTLKSTVDGLVKAIEEVGKEVVGK